MCRSIRVTVNVPATPTSPPAAPATTEMTPSFAVEVTETSFAAFTIAPPPMYESVKILTRWTPAPTPTPAVPPMATVAAMPSSW